MARHTGAKSVEVNLKVADGALHLSIQDHDKGFEVRPDSPVEGLGLLSMKERVRLVHGTQIEVRVPVSPISRGR